jgi:hypothetical protein
MRLRAGITGEMNDFAHGDGRTGAFIRLRAGVRQGNISIESSGILVTVSVIYGIVLKRVMQQG